MSRRLAAALTTALLLLLTACAGDDATDTAAEGTVETQRLPGRAEEPDVAVEEESALQAAEAPAQPGAVASEEATAATGPGVVGAGGVELPPPPDLPTSDRIIKEGTVTLQIGEGEFESAYALVLAEARTLGGTVVGSTTSTQPDGGTFGSLTVRVPVANYEDLLVGVGAIGDVTSQDITSQDVSQEFVDLESRLRHLQAQEAFYLGLMAKAQVVGDAIAVQQQLDGIQEQIEQVRGRINYLDERSSFSTLTVQLVEPGAVEEIVEPVVEEGPERPSFSRFYDQAHDAFVNVMGSLLVLAFFAAPLLVPAVVGFMVWRMIRRRRPAAPGSVPPMPHPPAEREVERV